MLTLIQRDLLAGKPGRVSITAARQAERAVCSSAGATRFETIKELIAKLDQPVEPQTQLRVFRLRHAPAATGSTTVQEFFARRHGPGAKVTVIRRRALQFADRAGRARDMAEVELLVTRIDTGRSESVNQVRIFKLKNSLAGESRDHAASRHGIAARGGRAGRPPPSRRCWSC